MKDDGYKVRDQYAVHFITFAVVEWVDVFTKKLAHLIISAPGGDLSGIIRDFKKFTSKAIIDHMETSKAESRRNWMLWIFKKAGEDNSRNNHSSFGGRTIIRAFAKHRLHFRQTQLHPQQSGKSRPC